MQAVILAAGMGTRIREHFLLPKGFITLGKKPIVVESIEKLKRCGINNILIVTGHLSPHYEQLSENDPHITTQLNKHFQQHGSLYSLYCAREKITDDFLLLESDIIYEKRALKEMLQDAHPNSILISGRTYSEDEVYVEAHDKQLINMGKQINKLNQNNIAGEFVGINKVSLDSYHALMTFFEKNESLLQTGHYEETGLVALSQINPVHCLKIDNLLWSEIDNVFHLQRAKGIYQEILQHENVSKNVIFEESH